MVRIVAIVSLFLVGIVGIAWAGYARSADDEASTIAAPGGCTIYGSGTSRTIEPGTPVKLVEPGKAPGMPVRTNVAAWQVVADGQNGSVYIDCLALTEVDALRVHIAETEAASEARIADLESQVAVLTAQIATSGQSTAAGGIERGSSVRITCDGNRFAPLGSIRFETSGIKGDGSITGAYLDDFYGDCTIQ